MRNLKKVFAVILTVALLASLMVPALAAVSHEAEALKLQKIGLMAGGPADLKLDEGVTRIQGLAFAIRAAGKEAEAFAMTEEEAAAELAKFVDADQVPGWGKKYAAYAIKYGITVGVGNNKFAALDPISGTSFLVFLLKSGMGYSEVTTANVVDKAVEVGVLSAGDAVYFGSKAALIRDDAAAILFGAAMNGVNANGKKFIQSLIDAGFVDAKVAAENGFIAALAITSVKAAKVNVLEVTFSRPVEDDVTFTVKRGSNSVSVDNVKWNSNKTVATLTTTSKMINGTHTVTAKVGDVELTGSTEVVSQHVDKIVILNDVALTGKNATEAYVYYDVLDQYGESLRSSTNIEWSFSTGSKATINKNTGKIALERSDEKAFTYGEKIYITGVHVKTGTTVTATLSVGMAQALDKIEVAGYVKYGTSDIIKTLPAGFKANTYYLLYTAVDQNGNPLEVDKPVTNNEITFIVDNVLLVKELDKTTETKITIDGVEYNAIAVVPGINVSRGGEVTITAIANKTGNKTSINTAVGEDQILTSFVMSAPTEMIADGESVEIPFVALDQNGEEIKNFVTLAKHKDFNKLTLNTSAGKLVLKENDDGTAKLVYEDETVAWNDPAATDGLDRTVSLTSVVIGGDSSNQMIYIRDKARPDGIKAVKMDSVLVERGANTFKLAENFRFVDQYGRQMGNDDEWGKDNGFFSASSYAGNDFAGYKFAIRLEYKGDAKYVTGIAPNTPVKISTTENETVTVTAASDVTASAVTGLSLKFDIVKYKGDNFADAESVSPVKNESLTIVDIKVVKDFTIGDLNKFYVNTSKSNDVTGDTGAVRLDNTSIDELAAGAKILPGYVQEVKVKGTYNGKEVTIPAIYFEVTSDKLVADGNKIIDVTTTGDALVWGDLYDFTTARYLRKDAKDALKATVYLINADNSRGEVLDTTSKEILISDAKPVVTTIKGADEITANPNVTKIVIKDLVADKDYKYYDQYGVEITVTPSFKVSSVVENAAGYAENSFKVVGNDSNNATVEGAERGDTFVLTIKAGDVTKVVKVTVGADTESNITNNTNNYLDQVVKALDN